MFLRVKQKMKEGPTLHNKHLTSNESYVLMALPAAVLFYAVFVLVLLYWPGFSESYSINLQGLSDLSLVVPNIITLYCIFVCCLLVRVTKPFIKAFAFKKISWASFFVWLIVSFMLALSADCIKYANNVPFESEWQTYLQNKHMATIIFFGLTTVLIPFFEELLFRGFIYHSIANSYLGASGAVALTTYLWAIPASYHNPYLLGINVAYGLVLAFARYKTKSVWTPVMIHIISSMLESTAFVTIISYFN